MASPVREAIKNAREVPPPQREPANGGYDGDDDGVPPAALPEGCPVTPLGTIGQKNFYLDATAHYVELTAKEHGRNNISQLFKHKNQLLFGDDYWPRKTEVKLRDARGKVVKDAAGDPVYEWVVNGFAADKAADALIAACGAKGTWNPRERMRDVGAWAGAAGELILHCGDVVWVNGVWIDPGEIGDYVYPAGEAVLRPPPDVAPRAAIEKLYRLLQSWNWRRGELDARLLLGLIAAMMICGALECRPTGWVTGDSGTGKSTLQKLLGWLFGRLILQTADATEAGLSQELGLSTRPVAVDELEADEDNRRVAAVVKLATLAAYGNRKVRGGSDHKSVEFALRSAFLFSAVLMPPMRPQDRNRQAILELDDLRPGQKLPEMSREAAAKMGTALLGRMARGWARLPATLARYRDALAAGGHTARGADVFGTLLACADLALADAAPDSDAAIEEWTDQLRPQAMIETADAQRDHERMLAYLGSVGLPRDGAALQRKSIAELALEAATPWNEMPQGGEPQTPELAQKLLGRYGMKVVAEGYGDRRAEFFFIANSHAELAKLFQDTHWRDGGWVQALTRVPLMSRPEQPEWLPGRAYRGSLIPLAEIASRKPKEARAQQPAQSEEL